MKFILRYPFIYLMIGCVRPLGQKLFLGILLSSSSWSLESISEADIIRIMSFPKIIQGHSRLFLVLT